MGHYLVRRLLIAIPSLLGISLVLFTVLALDATRARRHDLPTPVLALLSALVARLVFPGQMLLAAFVLFTAALLAQRLVVTRRPTHA